VVKAAYKALAVLNHPDKGGETEVMQRINDAYRRLAA
jgi:curved DNA-binding protein CbpA